LGLAISKAYVEALGGKIWAEKNKSNPLKAGLSNAKGSTFYFTLPYKQEKD